MIRSLLPIQAFQKVKAFVKWLQADGRHFQIISQSIFLSYGLLVLSWDSDWVNYLAIFTGGIGMQLIAIRYANLPMHSLKSAAITCLGLSLLFKANEPVLFLFAAALAISQKFLIKINGKHLWNPANFGIIILILTTGEAWVSPGQWGSSALLVWIIATAGIAVLTNVRRMDTALAFLVTISMLEYLRTVLYLGWGTDVFLHKMSSGSLWLFALFMITDPMTTPNSRKVRVLWASAIAATSFYLGSFHFINAPVQWVLFAATPFTPLLDSLVAGTKFNWIHKKLVQVSHN